MRDAASVPTTGAASVAALDTHPPLLRVRPAVDPDLDVGAGWATGSEGERFLGARLDADAADHGDVDVLHARRVPGTRATVDHVVIGPSGVWVVDAQAARGTVRHEDRGGWLRSDWCLTVGGRERTALVEGVARQVEAVRSALAGTPGPDVPVRGALCFVRGEFGWRFRPFEVDGVVVAWPRALRSIVRAGGPVGRLHRTVLAGHLDVELRPA